MATDTGQGTAAFRYFGGGVMWAAGTEMRHAVFVRIRLGDHVQHGFLGFQIGHAFFNALLYRVTSEITADTRSNRPGDLCRAEFIGGRQ